MENDFYIFRNFAHSLASCIHHFTNRSPVFFSTHKASSFISNLNHSDCNSCCTDLFKARLCKVINCIALLVYVKILPCTRRLLFCRVCPKVRIMKIHKQRHSFFCCTLADFNYAVQIIIAAAKTLPVVIKRIIP